MAAQIRGEESLRIAGRLSETAVPGRFNPSISQADQPDCSAFAPLCRNWGRIGLNSGPALPPRRWRG
jgi:hypothetical protein